MMHQGRIVVDMGAEEKKRLTISDLVNALELAAGEQFKDDTILLSHR
jgi:putative ABC transport system ATP-binding protein